MTSDALTAGEEAAGARRSSPAEQLIATYWPASASEASYARSVSDAARAWIDLSSPWRAAFDEAWMSWRQGSLGVGAAIADDGDQIIARGHNQFFHAGPGPISSTYMAHAEMNALAQLPVGRGQRYSIYSSFEPCYMCTSALLFYRIERVAFASVDPVWLGMHEWLQSAPWASRNHLTRECLGGELGAFGYVSRLAEIAPTHVLETHQQETSQLFDFATSSVVCDVLTGLAATNEPATTDSVLANLWKDLVRMGPSRSDSLSGFSPQSCSNPGWNALRLGLCTRLRDARALVRRPSTMMVWLADHGSWERSWVGLLDSLLAVPARTRRHRRPPPRPSPPRLAWLSMWHPTSTCTMARSFT